MPLIRPLGLHLGSVMRVLETSTTGFLVAWALCLTWTASVLILHFYHGSQAAKIIARVDFPTRVAIATGLGALAIYGIAADTIILADWFA